MAMPQTNQLPVVKGGVSFVAVSSGNRRATSCMTPETPPKSAATTKIDT